MVLPKGKPKSPKIKIKTIAYFTDAQKNQLRAQIMSFKYLKGNDTIPSSIIVEALKGNVSKFTAKRQHPGDSLSKHRKFNAVSKQLNKRQKVKKKIPRSTDRYFYDVNDEDENSSEQEQQSMVSKSKVVRHIPCHCSLSDEILISHDKH